MRPIAWTGLGLATVAAFAWNAPAMADDMVEDRLATMEQRIKYLEERVASQDRMIVEKESEIASLADGWFNSVSVGGVIELELVSESPAGEKSTTSAGVGTAELGIGAAINDEWSGEIVIENDDGTIALADAFLTYEPTGTALSASMGQQGLPFGVYETNLISDPLAKGLGDTGDVSLILGGEFGLLNWSVFTLNSVGGEFGQNFGSAVGFATEGEDSSFGVDVSWIADIRGSGDISTEVEFADEVPGVTASARGRLGPASVMIEVVTALDALEAEDLEATPSAWSVEAAYDFPLMGRDATAAVGAGGSKEAEAAGVAETLMLLGVSVGVWENVGVGIEWSQSEDYGGGGTNDAITVLLAAEF